MHVVGHGKVSRPLSLTVSDVLSCVLHINMASRCCVPCCRGNYPAGLKVATFSFSENETLLAHFCHVNASEPSRDSCTPHHAEQQGKCYNIIGCHPCYNY